MLSQEKYSFEFSVRETKALSLFFCIRKEKKKAAPDTQEVV